MAGINHGAQLCPWQRAGWNERQMGHVPNLPVPHHSPCSTEQLEDSVCCHGKAGEKQSHKMARAWACDILTTGAGIGVKKVLQTTVMFGLLHVGLYLAT